MARTPTQPNLVSALALFGLVLGVAQAAGANSPPAADEAPRLVVMSIEAVETDPAMAETLTRLAVQRIHDTTRFDILASEDIKKMLEYEAAKEQSGCEKDGSCLAEIANALGARLVMHGKVSRLAGKWTLTLAIFDAHEARIMARKTIQAKTTEELVEGLNPVVDQLIDETRGLMPRAFASRGSALPWVLVGTGAVALAAGAIIGGYFGAAHWAVNQERESADGSGDAERIARANRAVEASNGSNFPMIWVGIGIGAVGTALLVGGGIWALSDGE
jgi:TolB-like protein